jgi:cell division protein FtsZ
MSKKSRRSNTGSKTVSRNGSNHFTSDQGGPNGAQPREAVDLLEIGQEDGADLLMFEDSSNQKATIKVIGVGGGGGNALNNMIESGLKGVEFVCANTDAQALAHNMAPIKIQLGPEITRGLGCGANPDRGRAAALEARDRLREILVGADMIFVTAGMGGGTGTGAAPIVAEVGREVGALTVAVVTKPFQFEGKVRTRHSDRGLDELHQVVDTLITIPNQRVLALAGKGTNIKDAFRLADGVLLNAVRGISDLITIHGLINLDFADVRTVMNEAGVALMGTGSARGDTRAVDAARSAISSPLLEDLSIDGARGVLINITGGESMTLFEVDEASSLIQEAAHEDANIIFGAVIDESMPEDEMRVTVIATGLDDARLPRRERTHSDDFATVHPLREIGSSPEPLNAALAGPLAPGSHELRPARAIASEESLGVTSPFDEDEYETPAFLRKRHAEEPEAEVESPAFIRRAQD